jgi:methionyl-tRNA formyltransferase
MKRVLLFINGKLGLEVTNYLLSQPDIEITGVVVNHYKKRTESYTSQLFDLSASIRLFTYSENLHEQLEFKEVLNASELAVSALFGHIIPESLVSSFGVNFINLHPSLLPLGRGADPIPWAIIENQRQGVSIHVLEKKLDSGPIISQSEIEVTLAMTAGDIYELAMVELLRLFKEFIKSWPNGTILRPQVGESSFHETAELHNLREKLASGSTELEKSLRILQALTFADGRAPRLRLTDGELWEILISMSKVME